MSKSTKTIGARTAMAFAMECMERGAIVSEPHGDDAPYDLLVDAGDKIYRVQVKTAAIVKKGGETMKDRSGNNYYHANTQRIVPRPGKKSQVIPYKEGDLDALVTRAGDTWYLISEPHKLKKGINLYPHSAGKNKYEQWRNRWELLGLSPAADDDVLPEVDVSDDEVDVDEEDVENRPEQVEPPFEDEEKD